MNTFRNLKAWTLSMAFVSMLFSCERAVLTDDAPSQEPENSSSTTKPLDSNLTIVTRSAESGGVVSYPVTVYVIDENGTCVSNETLPTADDELALTLASGTYRVLAVGGASADNYELPSADDAAASSPVTLKEGCQHGDLMTAQSPVTIGRNQQNKLTLSFERKVMQVGDITVSDIPAEVTAVSVSLSPLYKRLLLDGSYESSLVGETAAIALTKQADGTTWKNTSHPFLLPSWGLSSITVSMTLGGSTTNYQYSTSLALAANKSVNISGRYTGDKGMFSLSGTFTGAVWDEDINIAFSFNEGGSYDDTQSDDNTQSGNAPAKGTWYKDCYVFLSTPTDNGVTVTLVHKDEISISAEGKTEEDVLVEINNSLSSFNINDLTNWRIPTQEEATEFPFGILLSSKEVTEHGGTIANGSDHYYYIDDNGALKGFIQVGFSNATGRDYTYGRRFRPVTTLTFKNNP